MYIKYITDNFEKQKITQLILDELPQWFGIKEAKEEYIEESQEKIFLCAYEEDKPIGFLYLKETGRDTIELYAMGILVQYHRQGIGRKLVEEAKQVSVELGFSFLQVKTVQIGRCEEYDRTNRFYLALGFKEFERFPHLWDEWNPCQVYVMSLK